RARFTTIGPATTPCPSGSSAPAKSSSEVRGSCRGRRPEGLTDTEVRGSCRGRRPEGLTDTEVRGSCRGRRPEGFTDTEVRGSCRGRRPEGLTDTEVRGSCRGRRPEVLTDTEVRGSCRGRRPEGFTEPPPHPRRDAGPRARGRRKRPLRGRRLLHCYVSAPRRRRCVLRRSCMPRRARTRDRDRQWSHRAADGEAWRLRRGARRVEVDARRLQEALGGRAAPSALTHPPRAR